MEISWSGNALADLDNIVRYIFPNNPFAALRIEEMILGSVQNLVSFPYLGRVG